MCAREVPSEDMVEAAESGRGRQHPALFDEGSAVYIVLFSAPSVSARRCGFELAGDTVALPRAPMRESVVFSMKGSGNDGARLEIVLPFASLLCWRWHRSFADTVYVVVAVKF